jgi:hypothetical protein
MRLITLNLPKTIKRFIFSANSNLIPYGTPPSEQFTQLTQNPGRDMR